MIVKYTNSVKPEITYQIPLQIDCNSKKINHNEEKEEEKEKNDGCYNVLCVKWGTLYDAEYVNKLFRGVKRNTTKLFKFYCFTEDANGLLEDINVIKLKEDWKGWWGKATLFSQGFIFHLFKKKIFSIFYCFYCFFCFFLKVFLKIMGLPVKCFILIWI